MWPGKLPCPVCCHDNTLSTVHGRGMAVVKRDGGVERIDVEPANSYRLELENVGAAAAGEAELLLGRDDAMGQARTLESLHRSAQTGAPVSL